MNNERIPITPGFRRVWIATNALGLGVGLALFAAIGEGIEQSGVLGAEETGEFIGHLIGLLLAGALFGLMQWRVLRRYGAWALWATLGAGLGLWLGYGLGYEVLGFPFDYILGPGLAATLSAIAFSGALRRHGVPAGWWVAASALGFMLGGAAGLVPAFLGLGEAIGTTYLGWSALNGLMGGIAGAVGGAITGNVLARRLRHAAVATAADLLASGTP